MNNHRRWTEGQCKLQDSLRPILNLLHELGRPLFAYHITSLSRFLSGLRGQHQYQEALGLIRKCAQLREQAFCLDDLDTIFSRHTLNKWKTEDLDLQAFEVYEKR